MDGAEPVELGEYEAKRRRRMEENRKKLLELNMFKIPRRPAQPRAQKPEFQEPVAATRRSARQRAQRLERAQNAERAMERDMERRRLLRRHVRERFGLRELRPKQESESGSEEEVEAEDEEAREPGTEHREAKRMKRETPQALDLPVLFPTTTVSAQPSASQGRTQHLSSSLLPLDLEAFHSRWLGKQLFPVGKRTVMQGMCPPGFGVRFSNMSGVQPWKNGVALFVNVESDSQYDNVFQEAELLAGQRAVHFQWFGQSRWQDASPVMVRRLLLTQRGDERLRFDETYYDSMEGSAGEPEPLLLFLRQTQGPYVYCGRLGYLGHRASQPMEFRWQLLDVASLDWPNVRRLLGKADSTKVAS